MVYKKKSFVENLISFCDFSLLIKTNYFIARIKFKLFYLAEI